MSVLRFLGASAVAAAIGLPCVALGEQTLLPSPDALTLTPTLPAASESTGAAQSAATDQQSPPEYLDAAPDAPNIHGFVEVPFKTAYVTPRGLVVQNQGLVIQPVGGLVFPIGDIGPVKGFTFVTGVWNSIDFAEHDSRVGPWDEMDYFASLSGNVDKFSGTLTYGAWNFPQSGGPHTEHNIDFKLSYDDTDTLIKGFAFKPYVDFFWAVTGSSTVVLGRQGSTYYFELGAVPSYTYKEIHDYPLTFTFPTYISVGPRNYWDRTEHSGHFGVFSTAVNVSVPLTFIPVRYGFWHADAGLQYFYLINSSLLHAGDILSGNNNRNVLNASVGFGVNF